MSYSNLRSFVEAMPKGENHLHVEGAIYPEWALEFGQKNNIDLPFSSVEEARKLYDFSNLDEFLAAFSLAGSTLITRDDYRDLVVKIGQEAKDQNILYREMMFTNSSHLNRGIALETFMEGFREGKAYVEKNLGVDMKFIAELDRMQTGEYSLAYVKSLADYTDLISAVGLDFAEKGYPAKNHAEAFKLAREMGFVVTNHAGEECGPESIYDSLDNCGASRIDHGVRAVEDPKLMRRLVEEKIPLHVCPLSNVSIGVFPNLKSHTFKALYDAGVNVTLNSDDPPFFFKNLNDNYCEVAETFELTRDDVYRIARNAFEFSLADEASKKRYIKQLDDYFATHDLN